MALAGTVASALFIANNVAVTTATEDLISTDAPFRIDQASLREAFPKLTNTVVLSIESPYPEARTEAAQRLVAVMEEEPELFREIFAPPTMPFFQDNGLLFRSLDEVETIIDRLAEAQPLLTSLAAQPDTVQLIELLSDAVERSPLDQPLDPILLQTVDTLAPALVDIVEGSIRPLSWLALLDAPVGGLNERVLIEIVPALDTTRLQPARVALDRLDELGRQVEQQVPGVSVAVTGKIALQRDELRSASVGAGSAGLLSLVLVTLFMVFGIRSFGGVVALLVTLIVGLAATAAFGVAVFATFNLISVAFAVLFIGLGVDFAIHTFLRAQEAVSDGASTEEAIVTAVTGVGPALLICAPTTAVAFLAFTATDYVGLAQLGVIAAAGMLIAVALSLTLLPALVSLFGCPPLKEIGVRRLARRTSPKVVTWLAYGLLAISALGIVAGTDVRFNSDPMNLRDPQAPSMQALEALRMGGQVSPYGAEILVYDDAEAAGLAAVLESLPLVERVLWRDRFIPAEQDAKLAAIEDALLFIDLPRANDSPVIEEPRPLAPALLGLEAAAAARLAALAPDLVTVEPQVIELAAAAAAAVAANPGLEAAAQENWFRFWPSTLETLGAALRAQRIDLESLPSDLLARFVGVGGTLRLDVQPVPKVETPADIDAFAASVRAIATDAAGPAVQIAGAGALVSDAMRKAMVLAAVGVGLMLLLVVRRPGDVMLILITAVVAIGLTLGAMWVIGLDFNYANVIVLPLLLGFGIDTSIHMVLRARDEGDASAVLQTSTPRAVLLSALTTLASFGTLILAAHRGTQSMGILLTMAVVASLLASLIVLPALLQLRQLTENAISR